VLWGVVVVALGTLAPAPATATGVPGECRVPKSSNEAKLLAFYSAPVSFSPASAPEHAPLWTLRLGGEVGLVPDPDSAIQQSSFCFIEKTEHTRLSPFFVRPRLTLTLPRGFTLEASYLPPVDFRDAEANLLSGALSWTKRLRMAPTENATDIMLRMHGTAGQVKGSITCPAKALQQADPMLACYGTSPSLDTFKPRMLGIEGIVSTAAWDGRLAFYAGAGGNFLRPRFKVGFNNAQGFVDSTVIAVDVNRVAMFVGVSAEVTSTVDLSAQVYGVREDGVTFRFGGGYRLYR
jgi:hypothetical protein